MAVCVAVAVDGRLAWGQDGARCVHIAPAEDGLSAAQLSPAVLLVKGTGGWVQMREAESHLAAQTGARVNQGRSAVQKIEMGTVRIDGANRVLRNTISRSETP